MNIRFAEECRATPLDLDAIEDEIQLRYSRDGRSQKQMLLTCETDIYIGVFFDGTNNNKYRDTPNFAHSNVARLYEAFPGRPAAQKEPELLPRVNANGSKTPRPIFPDREFKAASVKEQDYPYYRKIYIPGVGTPMPDAGDSGTGLQKSGGLAAAMLGQIRLDWAMLQLLNQVHAAILKTGITPAIDLHTLLRKSQQSKGVVPLLPLPVSIGAHAGQALQKQVQALWDDFERTTGRYDRDKFDALLTDYEGKLAAALKQYGRNKPSLRKIRLSVFGFSRGATAARSWVNMLNRRWGSALQGIPLQIDFLGLFDTVASVGLAQSVPHFDGHAEWADDPHMPVPDTVRRCVHLVSAHEVRGSFPLDSVCQNNALPPNCKEIVYPGVHSDVGGGYVPEDQGRALGAGAQGDKCKLSQIPLAQMYREARMAGVPLAPPNAMLDAQKRNFEIDPQLRADFNAYIAATRSGSIPPTQGKGHARFASMFPTETQPREELHRVIRRHAGIQLRWRKELLTRAGGIAGLPGLAQCGAESKYQDAEDLRGAEEELRKEIAFLQSSDPAKFNELDDPFFALVFDSLRKGKSILPLILQGKGIALEWLGTLSLWGAEKSLRGVMQDKQQQWDTWLREEWMTQQRDALPAAARILFERYVHDSRAWFKPFLRSDGHGMVPDDEAWFVFGGREKERRSRMLKLQGEIAALSSNGDQKILEARRKELQQLQQEGQPLLVGGREPYRMWGYVRHRKLYQTGRLTEAHVAQDLRQIESEEKSRSEKARRERMIAAEKARHEAELTRIRNEDRAVLTRPQKPAGATGPGPWRLAPEQEAEYLRISRSQIERENAFHAAQMERIDRETLEAAQ